ncbi:hypothetical protein RHMOL_Rhmol11G0211400 [Rhododendron molle]|uniref:Uncharacterized protein n=1 Tax=Rhododendron molle TaxID=49168 RepID=A0ACC0LVK9_RHOML|nr:hypothetical protein RHMOL_Rhmol11G0211400 [Rhododendron molle]
MLSTSLFDDSLQAEAYAAPCCAPPSRWIVHPTARESHLGSERLTIVGCRNEVRAVGYTIRRLGGVQHGVVWLNKPLDLLIIDVLEVDEEDDNNDEVFQGDEVDVEVDGVPIQVEDREVREDLVADTVDQSEIVTGNCLDQLNLSVTDDEEDDTMADYCTDNDQEDEFTDDDDDDDDD